MKCVAWSPQGLDQSISIPLHFFTPKFNFPIFDVPMGSLSFMESFVLKSFQKDFNMISNLLMLADLQVAFVILSFCYAQQLSYLQHTIFPSPSIL
jgi:hypothetical protein